MFPLHYMYFSLDTKNVNSKKNCFTYYKFCQIVIRSLEASFTVWNHDFGLFKDFNLTWKAVAPWINDFISALLHQQWL